jgi:hypothetical protein
MDYFNEFNEDIVTHYEIITNDHNYIASIIEDLKYNIFRFYLYNMQKKRICIWFSAEENKDTVCIESIEIQKNINILEILEDGKEIKMIIFIALNLLKNKFSYIKYATFHEKFSKLDERWNQYGATISTTASIIYLCYHNKTWFEDVLGATLVDTEIKEKYQKVKSMLLEDFKLDSYFSFDTYNPDLIALQEKYNLIIEDVYHECKFVMPFINRLKEIITDVNDLYKILDMFLYRTIMFYTNQHSTNILAGKWIISLDSIIKMDFKETLINDNPYFDKDDGTLFTDLI